MIIKALSKSPWVAGLVNMDLGSDDTLAQHNLQIPARASNRIIPLCHNESLLQRECGANACWSVMVKCVRCDLYFLGTFPWTPSLLSSSVLHPSEYWRVLLYPWLCARGVALVVMM
eukprot:156888-Pelagomonas_calceolata.AAC.1